MAERVDLLFARYQVILGRFWRFGVVGLTGVLINNGILIGLHEHFRLALIPASVLAVEAAILHNFIWNNHWTFGERAISPVRLAKYNLTALGGLAITTGTLYLLVEGVRLHYLPANLIGIGLATLWNFGVSATWTWRWQG